MKVFKHITSSVLALLVLTSSMGVVINKHYCMGDLQEISVNQKAEKCPMCKKLEQLPSRHQKQDEHKKGCCENEQQKIQTSDYSVHKEFKKDLINSFQFVAFSHVILENIHAEIDESLKFYKSYPPPLIDQNIPVLVQSFLL